MDTAVGGWKWVGWEGSVEINKGRVTGYRCGRWPHHPRPPYQLWSRPLVAANRRDVTPSRDTTCHVKVVLRKSVKWDFLDVGTEYKGRGYTWGWGPSLKELVQSQRVPSNLPDAIISASKVHCGLLSNTVFEGISTQFVFPAFCLPTHIEPCLFWPLSFSSTSQRRCLCVPLWIINRLRG